MLADFVAGWLAGGAGLLVGHPLDTVKARLQTSDVYSGIRDCFRQTLRNETMSGLYKGMLAPFLSVGFINSIFFASYGLTLKAFHPGDLHVLDRKDLPMLEILAASTVASFVQLLPNVPIEHVKTKLQVQRENAAHFWQSSASAGRRPQYAGPLDCTLQILRRDGLTGLYRGGVPNMVRDVIGFVFYMPVYQVLLRFLHPRTNETCAQILAGGTAGSVSWFSICPVEVVKNRLQTSHAKTSWLTETRSIFREEGPRGFYRGGLVLVLRGFPVNAVVFVVYENLLKALSPGRPEFSA